MLPIHTTKIFEIEFTRLSFLTSPWRKFTDFLIRAKQKAPITVLFMPKLSEAQVKLIER
ncbi:hypothetical protein PPEP_b0184 [Pseudoalteromonas peptidolytica F12-50-A1]|uniref:Uncharacterized protein n=1 Tax=Pseudoalteromonas peptidolytica F12-50-A1 TaxID=1315280 RepID=A0A8I0N0F3_9GAMM|nr:hypothetical protein [Pseudoalteromonas peptidolytica F12-50-A1]GEK10323.1 hypothetical protein PPE03_25720 [Pseudoalteromonas peptidolytica]